MKKTNYGLSKVVELSYEQALEKVTGELKKEGFGILTEIDVKATLKKKIDVDFKPYKILGACNPHFAHKSLLVEEQIGLFLPCNVIVYVDDQGNTVVSAVDPLVAMQAVQNEDLLPLATEVKKKLQNIIDAL